MGTDYIQLICLRNYTESIMSDLLTLTNKSDLCVHKHKSTQVSPHNNSLGSVSCPSARAWYTLI